jgi:hypothetical protein
VHNRPNSDNHATPDNMGPQFAAPCSIDLVR